MMRLCPKCKQYFEYDPQKHINVCTDCQNTLLMEEAKKMCREGWAEGYCRIMDAYESGKGMANREYAIDQLVNTINECRMLFGIPRPRPEGDFNEHGTEA